jgi:hypothetical protein
VSDGDYFDRQPFGFSFSRSYIGGRRAGDAPGWDGPPDPSPAEEAAYEREYLARQQAETPGEERRRAASWPQCRWCTFHHNPADRECP